jgi:hypothetical protein
VRNQREKIENKGRDGDNKGMELLLSWVRVIFCLIEMSSEYRVDEEG